MKFLSNIFLLLITAVVLSSCQTTSPGNESDSISEAYGFKKSLVKGGDFWITTYQRISDTHQPHVFYIEGDGAAFAGKYRVSNNPTPKKRMLIKLASMDDRPNVVYIARPCQYTPMALNPTCSSEYWTNKRLSDDSVSALNEVINSINNNLKFSLIGFSGGGGIVVSIAARNPLVKDIITIAGNLDHIAFTEFHNVTPMLGSLNPIDYALQIKHIPQLHLSGSKDTIIPPFIASKFVEQASSPCVKQKVYVGNSHQQGWDKVWKEVYTQRLRCE